MFKRFYNMATNPFSKELAAADAHTTKDMTQVHKRLDHLARTGGIGLITANPGMGKTFAVRTWASKLNPNNTKIVYVCMSTVTNLEFYRQLCYEFGLDLYFKKSDMYRDMQACIHNLVDERGMRVVVVIDEAQYLPTSVLRDLQMLVNFDMDSRDLMALVLVGHSVLCQYLSRQPYESLRQRIVVNYHMEGLDENQAKDYVRNMLLKSGADPDIFDDAALVAAHGVSGGSIRRLNSIIVNALMIGAQQQSRSIDAEMVRSAAEELSIV